LDSKQASPGEGTQKKPKIIFVFAMEDDQQERDVDDQVGGADGKEVSQQAVMKTTVIENLIKANMTPNDKDAILKAESLKGLAQFLVAVCSNPQHEQEFAAICQQPNGLLPILGTAAGVTHYASVSGMGSVVMIVSQVGRALNTMRKYRRLTGSWTSSTSPQREKLFSAMRVQLPRLISRPQSSSA
jgi:hypothetical protein